MKNLFLISFLLFSINSFSQVNPHAIGLRGGSGNYGAGGEVTYQHGFGDANRLEIDLGWRGNNGWGNNNHIIVLSGIYHWVWNLDGGLNWYAGIGAQIGDYKLKNKDEDISGIIFGIGGQVGIEYDFNVHEVPLLLSLDARPMLGFQSYYGFGYGGALALRYTF